MTKPFAYGYARASHHDNMGSIPAQINRINDYYKSHLLDQCQWGQVHWDEQPVSASKIPFPRRKTGIRLLSLMKPGDHIIFDKIDRIWRSIQDFVNLIQYFRDQKITVHIIDMRGCTVAMNTPMGDFMLTLMVAIAELESKTTSHRIKEAKHALIEDRVWAFGQPMYGCKIIRAPSGKRRLVFDDIQRKKMAEIVRLVDEEGMSFSDVDALIGPFSNNQDRHVCVLRLYRREKMFRVLKITDPMDLPRGKALRELEELFGTIKHKYSLEKRLQLAAGVD